jgi:hypothetical protein
MGVPQHALEVFARLCVGRRDTYAVQRDDGRYVRVGERLTYARLWEHLAGRLTLGTYVIDEQGMCRFAVFDDDRADGLARLAEVQARLRSDRVPSCLEVSRRGGHLWVWLSRPVRASLVRGWLRPYVAASVEFYPRQDESDGLGSLIRLPLGVHRVTGQRYPFVAWRDGGAVAVASSVAGMVAYLGGVERWHVPADDASPKRRTAGQRTQPHPSLSPSVAPRWNSPYTTIADWCAAQDPYALIGRYMALDSRGMGCCPFGEHHCAGRDRHPSLRVYEPRRPGGSCWFCYTWGQGGTAFDFLRYYHRLSARDLWRRIQADERV